MVQGQSCLGMKRYECVNLIKMAGNPMSIRVARARREQSALTDPYNQNNRNYGNQEIFSRNDQYNDYQTDRRPGKVETTVLSMFCSNHVQNMVMEHVLVHVLFLFSLIFVSEHKNTNFGT